jgi:hypothetical protein
MNQPHIEKLHLCVKSVLRDVTGFWPHIEKLHLCVKSVLRDVTGF